jgi:hypothetical protein
MIHHKLRRVNQPGSFGDSSRTARQPHQKCRPDSSRWYGLRPRALFTLTLKARPAWVDAHSRFPGNECVVEQIRGHRPNALCVRPAFSSQRQLLCSGGFRTKGPCVQVTMLMAARTSRLACLQNVYGVSSADDRVDAHMKP